jgi:four helix bundle protein
MVVVNYTDLIVWQKGMDFVEAVYKRTSQFPREDIYGLTSQLRRAAVSIPANIAEGQGRRSSRDFRRFLAIAYGSLREAETHILIAERLNYLAASEKKSLMAVTAEIGRLLNGLSNSLREPRSPQ